MYSITALWLKKYSAVPLLPPLPIPPTAVQPRSVTPFLPVAVHTLSAYFTYVDPKAWYKTTRAGSCTAISSAVSF